MTLLNYFISILFSDAPADKKEGIRAKVKEYMDRAEQIKQKVIEEKEGSHMTKCIHFFPTWHLRLKLACSAAECCERLNIWDIFL